MSPLNPIDPKAWIADYLNAKAAGSIANDVTVKLRFWNPPVYKRIPNFGSPEAVGAWYQKHGSPYTGDPIYGVGDHYIHPCRFYAAVESGNWAGISIDCDDVAGLAFVAAKQMEGMQQSHVITLFDRKLKMSHVIWVGQFKGRYCAVDTNGYRELPNLDEATLIREWNAIYKAEGADYLYAIDTWYPFDNVA